MELTLILHWTIEFTMATTCLDFHNILTEALRQSRQLSRASWTTRTALGQQEGMVWETTSG